MKREFCFVMRTSSEDKDRDLVYIASLKGMVERGTKIADLINCVEHLDSIGKRSTVRGKFMLLSEEMIGKQLYIKKGERING